MNPTQVLVYSLVIVTATIQMFLYRFFNVFFCLFFFLFSDMRKILANDARHFVTLTFIVKVIYSKIFIIVLAEEIKDKDN